MTGEESISIVRRGRWVWKQYKPLDPTGRWPSLNDWITQLERRVEVSRTSPQVNPVLQWYSDSLIAVSEWIEPERETTDGDVAGLRYLLPKWIGDITPDNIIVGTDGPVLIDFCVKG